MFDRKLKEEEIVEISRMELFIRDKHSKLQGHDYSHVLAVTNYAIQIAGSIEEPVDPFILIAGALFHDIGRVGAEMNRIHGLIGATITDEYLKAVGVDRKRRNKIVRIVVRHTGTSMLAPETVTEKVVFDADDLDRLGLMGMLRGMMVGAVQWSMEDIIENRLEKRKKDYERLHFEASREIGARLYEETLQLIQFIRSSMRERYTEIAKLTLPGAPSTK